MRMALQHRPLLSLLLGSSAACGVAERPWQLLALLRDAGLLASPSCSQNATNPTHQPVQQSIWGCRHANSTQQARPTLLSSALTAPHHLHMSTPGSYASTTEGPGGRSAATAACVSALSMAQHASYSTHSHAKHHQSHAKHQLQAPRGHRHQHPLLQRTGHPLLQHSQGQQRSPPRPAHQHQPTKQNQQPSPPQSPRQSAQLPWSTRHNSVQLEPAPASTRAHQPQQLWHQAPSNSHTPDRQSQRQLPPQQQCRATSLGMLLNTVAQHVKALELRASGTSHPHSRRTHKPVPPPEHALHILSRLMHELREAREAGRPRSMAQWHVPVPWRGPGTPPASSPSEATKLCGLLRSLCVFIRPAHRSRQGTPSRLQLSPDQQMVLRDLVYELGAVLAAPPLPTHYQGPDGAKLSHTPVTLISAPTAPAPAPQQLTSAAQGRATPLRASQTTDWGARQHHHQHSSHHHHHRHHHHHHQQQQQWRPSADNEGALHVQHEPRPPSLPTPASPPALPASSGPQSAAQHRPSSHEPAPAPHTQPAQPTPAAISHALSTIIDTTMDLHRALVLRRDMLFLPSFLHYIEAVLPLTSPAHALELCAHTVRLQAPSHTAIGVLRLKLSAWLEPLLTEARTLPPDKEARLAWLERVLRIEKQQGDGTVAHEAPDLDWLPHSFVPHVQYEHTSLLGWLLRSIIGVSHRAPMFDQVLLALKLASCVPEGLTAAETCVFARFCVKHFPESHSFLKAMITQAVRCFDQAPPRDVVNINFSVKEMYCDPLMRECLSDALRAAHPAHALNTAAQPFLPAPLRCSANPPSTTTTLSGIAQPAIGLSGKIHQLVAALLLRQLSCLQQQHPQECHAPALQQQHQCSQVSDDQPQLHGGANLPAITDTLKQAVHSLNTMGLQPFRQPQVLSCMMGPLTTLATSKGSCTRLALITSAVNVLLPTWAPPCLPTTYTMKAASAAPHAHTSTAALDSGGSLLPSGLQQGESASSSNSSSSSSAAVQALGESASESESGAHTCEQLSGGQSGQGVATEAAAEFGGAVQQYEQGGWVEQQRLWEEWEKGQGALAPKVDSFWCDVSRQLCTLLQAGTQQQQQQQQQQRQRQRQSLNMWEVCEVLQGLEQAASGRLAWGDSARGSAACSVGPASGGVSTASMEGGVTAAGVLHEGAALPSASSPPPPSSLPPLGAAAAMHEPGTAHSALHAHSHSPHSAAAVLPFVHAMRVALPHVATCWEQQLASKHKQQGQSSPDSIKFSGLLTAPIKHSYSQSKFECGMFSALCSFVWHRSQWGGSCEGKRAASPSLGGHLFELGEGAPGGVENGRVGALDSVQDSWNGSSEAGLGMHSSVSSSSSSSTSIALHLMRLLLPEVNYLVEQPPCARSPRNAAEEDSQASHWPARVWITESAEIIRASVLAAEALALPPWVLKPPLPKLPCPTTCYPTTDQQQQQQQQQQPNQFPASSWPSSGPPPHPLLHLHSKMHHLPDLHGSTLSTPALLLFAEHAMSSLQKLLLQQLILPEVTDTPRIVPSSLYAVVQAAASVQATLPAHGLFSVATSVLLTPGFMHRRAINTRVFGSAALRPSQLLHMCLLLSSHWGMQHPLALLQGSTAHASTNVAHACGAPPILAGLVLRALASYTLRAQSALDQSVQGNREYEVLGYGHLQDWLSLLQPHPLWQTLLATQQHQHQHQHQHSAPWTFHPPYKLATMPPAEALYHHLHQQQQQQQQHYYSCVAPPATAPLAAALQQHPLAYLQEPQHTRVLAAHVQAEGTLRGVPAGPLIQLLAQLASLHAQQQHLFRAFPESLPDLSALPSFATTTATTNQLQPPHTPNPPPTTTSKLNSHTSNSQITIPSNTTSNPTTPTAIEPTATDNDTAATASSTTTTALSAHTAAAAARAARARSLPSAMFMPLVEVVADALLPSLPSLALPQLCALAQLAVSLLAAADDDSPLDSDALSPSKASITQLDGNPPMTTTATINTSTSSGSSSSSSGSGGGGGGGFSMGVSSVAGAGERADGSGSSREMQHERLGRSGKGDGAETDETGGMGGGAVLQWKVAHLATLRQVIVQLLDTRMQEFYLLSAEEVTDSLCHLRAARLCTAHVLAVAADALAWQLEDAQPSMLATLLLVFLQPHPPESAMSDSDSGSSDAASASKSNQGHGGGGFRGEALGFHGGGLLSGTRGSVLSGFLGEDQGGSSSQPGGVGGIRDAENAEAFTRELLGLLEGCLHEVELGQVLELVNASKVLGPYQRRRLLKQAARVLQPKVGSLQPEHLVRVMEEYSLSSSFWDRSLFVAAAADIACRPQEFLAEQLVRALHSLYASGTRLPQPYSDVSSALLKAPRASSTSGAPTHLRQATGLPHTSHTQPLHATAHGLYGSTTAFYGSTGSGTPHGLYGSTGMGWRSLGRASVETAHGGASDSASARARSLRSRSVRESDPGLTLWQLQSIYSVLKAVDHPQAAEFCQEFLQSGGTHTPPRPGQPTQRDPGTFLVS